MRIELFGRPYNRTDRVQWTLEELGLDYTYHILDVFGLEHRKPAFRDQYGLARLPFIRLDGQVLFESGAIMLVLAEHFRNKVDLIPEKSEPGYAKVLQWLFFANSTLDAAEENTTSNAPPSPFAPLVDVLSFLEAKLKDRDFIAAGRFTISDIALANNLKYVHSHLQSFPGIQRYFQHQTARPSYQKIKNQKEYKASY